MPDKKPQKPKSQTPLSGLQNDVNAFLRRRADNQKDLPNLADEVMPIRGGRRQPEVLLVISELENYMLRMNDKDANVYLAREKLTELKNLLAKNLGIK
jgi:hypothetical protein